MAHRFEMRAVDGRRLLGTIDTVDEMRPGEIVGLFRRDLVVVDVAAPDATRAPAATPPAAENHAPKRRKATAK